MTTYDTSRFRLLGCGETVEEGHYKLTEHGPVPVGRAYIGEIVTSETDDEFLVELPPDIAGYQHIETGFVEAGDVLVDDAGMAWADGFSIGHRIIDGLIRDSETRVYRNWPVAKQGDNDPSWRKVQEDLAPAIPFDSAHTRKGYPVATGVVDYFPLALMAIAECSRKGNEQHNPGMPLRWDRSKSSDEADALMRHFIDRGKVDSDGIRHSAKVAWRALALLEKELEASNPKGVA